MMHNKFKIYLIRILLFIETHLFQAATHGSTRNIPHISALVHMIIHTYIEQIICLVTSKNVHIIIAPRKTVTMDCPFSVIVISREQGEPRRLHKIIRRGVAQIDHAQISIIAWVFVHAVRVIWLGTVSIIIIRLTILRPAALGRLDFTLI